MSDNWDFYMCNVNGEIASIFVDLGIREEVPITTHPWLAWVWLHMKSPYGNGLSSSAELDTLHQIEEAFISELGGEIDAIFVGRITTQGRREFYFYAPRQLQSDKAIQRALTSFEGYTFDWDAVEQPDWDQYLSLLYPTPEQMQKINNRRVLDALEKSGDPLTHERVVQHWVYFSSVKDMEEFIRIVRELDFKIVSKSKHEDDEERFGVSISRVDFVHQEAINDVTLQLFRFAIATNGRYDGWETGVVKPDSTTD